MFNRNRKHHDELEAEKGYTVTSEMWDADPIGVTCGFVTSLGHPAPALAVTIYRLLSDGKMTPEDLLILGFTKESVDALINVVSAADNFEGVAVELSIVAAIREYDVQIDELMISHNLDRSKRAEFRKVLAGFAADNSMTDLSIAFRFMVATEPDRIDTFKITSH